MKRQVPFIIATVLATLFIFTNSLQNAEISGQSSGVLVNIISDFLNFIGLSADTDSITYFVRKAAHIMEYALQGLLLAGCFSMTFKRRIIYVLFFGLLTACVDEYLQLFALGRASMIQDVFIDFVGTIIGTFIFGITCRSKAK